MVSPVAKDDADVLVTGVASDGASLSATHQAAPDGQSLAFSSSGGFAGADSATLYGYFLSRRGGDPVDWRTASLNSPQGPYTSLRVYTLFANSADLTHTVFGSRVALAPGAVEGDGNLYIKNNLTGDIVLIAHDHSARFRALTDGTEGSFVYGGTSDFSRIVFTVDVPLTADAPTGVRNTYEWSASDGLRLVNYNPGGSTVDPAGGVAGRADGLAHSPNVMSADGSRIFFTRWSDNAIFMRVDGTESVPISASQRTGDDPTVSVPGQFQAASADGTKVVFASGARLTDGSRANGYATMYMYDTTTRRLSDLGAPNDPSNLNEARAEVLLGMSQSGDYVYFAAQGDIAPGGVEGQRNIYVNHDGVLSHVATLDVTADQPAQQAPSVSPDGRYFAFLSVTPLPGYDNVSPACLANRSDSRCGMVFVYDALRQDVTCVSCIADGTQGRGTAIVGGQAGSVAPVASDYYARAAIDSGVFFDTPDALVPGDTNNRYDVYEYSDGAVELISPGDRNFEAHFVDTGESGGDVFFSTRQQLVSQDVDGNTDVYDARVGGGIGSQNPPSQRDACTGVDCRTLGPANPMLPNVVTGSTFDARQPNDDTKQPRTAPGAARVTRRRLGANGLVVWVKVPAAGSVRVAARLLSPTRIAARKPGTIRVLVRFNRAGTRALKRRHRINVKAKVTYKPATGASSIRTVSASLRTKR
ncbi:MAG TPA: hypothetical protein VGM91_00570 [Conexibacter sp.]|jgi:Tol biopolymer transport system component